MSLWSGNKQLLCKVFPSPFGEITSDWFLKLLKEYIKNWEGLAEMFVAKFVMNKLQPLRVDYRLALKIDNGKSLRAYAKKYYEQSLAKTLPKSMEDLMARIEKYARAEEDTKVKKDLGKNQEPTLLQGTAKDPEGVHRQEFEKNCAYHDENGHMTQGCRALKQHLEDLVGWGHLRDLIDEAKTRKEHVNRHKHMDRHRQHHHHFQCHRQMDHELLM
ncbi:uncharacterized protein LOC114320581 [Camellia sinensis]|uniref:uncharacterized protein LOC114320581 n=1 Tax=Camellia sinensis TaxID=4442 RepID=UPI0010361111|nr:uncharacterized protein LOC114320581 [Camellia sinensis]